MQPTQSKEEDALSKRVRSFPETQSVEPAQLSEETSAITKKDFDKIIQDAIEYISICEGQDFQSSSKALLSMLLHCATTTKNVYSDAAALSYPISEVAKSIWDPEQEIEKSVTAHLKKLEDKELYFNHNKHGSYTDQRQILINEANQYFSEDIKKLSTHTNITQLKTVFEEVSNKVHKDIQQKFPKDAEIFKIRAEELIREMVLLLKKQLQSFGEERLKAVAAVYTKQITLIHDRNPVVAADNIALATAEAAENLTRMAKCVGLTGQEKELMTQLLKDTDEHFSTQLKVASRTKDGMLARMFNSQDRWTSKMKRIAGSTAAAVGLLLIPIGLLLAVSNPVAGTLLAIGGLAALTVTVGAFIIQEAHEKRKASALNAHRTQREVFRKKYA